MAIVRNHARPDMPLTAVTIEGYRSIPKIHFPVGALTVFVGRNGTGKTNLYRALELIHFAASGTITRAIAKEGGINSVLWSGKRKKGKRVRLILTAELGDLRYTIEIGLPSPMEAALELEPLVKAEELSLIEDGKTVTFLKRQGPTAWLRDEAGRRVTYGETLLPSETALASFRDAAQFPEVDQVRRALLDWRFYHSFRTDKASPIRQPSLAVTTPTLSSSGHDLASVLATVYGVRGDARDIDEAIADAFPGSTLQAWTREGRCSFAMDFPGLQRPFDPHELSDGTLSYLCLMGALLGYRLPRFIAFNEPETSLHPDLIAPLARLIANAAERTQIWVVTHSEALAVALSEETLIVPRTVLKEDGATWIEGLKLTGDFAAND